MQKTRKKQILGIILTIVILVTLVIFTNKEESDMSTVEGMAGKIVMPIQNGLTYLKNKIIGNNTFFTDINHLQEENQQLKQKNSELEAKLRELEIIKAENESLREYVNLKDKYTEYTTMPAYIINKDISNYSENIIINVGTKDGITKNMAVISEQGLVGHIISVTEDTAKVQTIVDTASTVSCTITSTRDNLIARGTLEGDTLLKANYVPTDATVLQGDTIETSGLGGIYPKGILIGTIKKVVNTKNITVLVITN